MKQDLFENLPSDITINILSRLPVRVVVTCKCVRKSWLRLLETPEFVKNQLSKSVTGLLVFDHESELHRIFDFEDGPGLERNELHYSPVAKFSLPFKGKIHGSVNGLLLLRDKNLKPDGLFICNPITRDYTKLDCPQEFVISDSHGAAYGFGVSKKSCEYKVVRISQEWIKRGDDGFELSNPEWHVYTLGTGSWRKIPSVSPHFIYGKPTHWNTRTTGPFLDGKLHWLVTNLNGGGFPGFPRICCFDLESETYNLMTTPLPPMGYSIDATISVLEGSLCLCDNTSETEIVIYVVEGRGDESFWVKRVVMLKNPEFFPFKFMVGLISVLKIFSDGDVLMEWDGSFLFYYSEKNKTKTFDMFHSWKESILHTPSFVSLKGFDLENVSTSFCSLAL